MAIDLIPSVLSVLVFESILVLCIAIPALHARPLWTIALLTMLGAMLTYAAPLGRHPSITHIWTVAWVPWLSTVSKVLVANGSLETRYWRKDGESRTSGTPVAQLVRKLYWSLDLIHNCRGIAWNWQVQRGPTSRASTPARFCIMNLVHLAALGLMYDAMNQINTALYSPLLLVPGMYPATIRHREWVRDAVHKICFGLLPVLQFNIIYISISISAVGTGLSSSQV